MNYVLKFNPAVPDVRCEKCKHHQYLILSRVPGVTYLHSHIASIRGNEFPYLTTRETNHSWNGQVVHRPLCLNSYKNMGVK